MSIKKEINRIKSYAKDNNVPIMTDDGIDFLMDYIKKNKIRRILEVGTAIGYSAIMMCSVHKDVVDTTIETDETRYLEAIKNIKSVNYDNRINLIYNDAIDVKIKDKFDLVFIDAAKAQNIKFFEKFDLNLNSSGVIITDNMNFHGLVNKDENEIKSRNLKQLVRKINDYKEFLINNKMYDTTFLDVGDGIAISIKK